MKQTIKIVIIAVCAIVGYLSHIGNQKSHLNELVLNNVAALASGEEYEMYYCIGSGEVPCDGDWVKVKIENYSLR